MAEKKVLYQGLFVKNPQTSETKHAGESYEVTVMGCDTNDEASIVYNQYLEWVTQKVARMCGFIEATDSLTGKQ